MEEFIKRTITEAGEKVMDFFGKRDIEYTKETPHDVVTKADLASSGFIIEAIKNAYPEHGIISEEAAPHQSDAEYIWYIDPLDGTRNFASNVPLFGINMGLAYQKEMVYAAVYLPATKEFCFAKKGGGARLNDKKIQCSRQQEWESSYGIASVRLFPSFVTGLARISHNKAWMSAIGTVAVSAVYVADGRRDWYMSKKSKIWDYAAPSLILEEAGCVVTNLRGKPWKLGDEALVVSNKYLHPQLLEISQSSESLS